MIAKYNIVKSSISQMRLTMKPNLYWQCLLEFFGLDVTLQYWGNVAR
jgi:hypothetical protein